MENLGYRKNYYLEEDVIKVHKKFPPGSKKNKK